MSSSSSSSERSVIGRRTALAAGAAAGVLAGRPARAQRQVVRLGLLSDMTGPYRDNGGPTSAVCMQQAIQDLGLPGRGVEVEMLVADHQNKPDIGLGIARQWLDRDGVDALVEVNNSAIAAAVNDLVTDRNKVHLCTGAGSVDITGARCSPNTVQWQTDNWGDGQVARPVTRLGGDKWFFIVADYTSGHLLRDYTARVVEASGGKVMGQAAYPFPSTTDFSSFLVQARASGANTVAFCNAGADLVNCIKQAHEFGLGGTRLVGVVTFLNVIHTVGLETAQGLLLTESFYWDLNDRTRGFLNRVKARTPDNWPNSEHACAYGGVTHYLKAVAALGVGRAKASGLDAVRWMKANPTDDDCFGRGRIQANGRVEHPLYLFQVKAPAESRSPWDLYKLVDTIPAEQGSRPVSESGCTLDNRFGPA